MCTFKVGIHLPKDIFTNFDEGALKIMKSALYLMVKTLFALKYLHFCTECLVIQKNSLIRKKSLILEFMALQTGQQMIITHTLTNILRTKADNENWSVNRI